MSLVALDKLPSWYTNQLGLGTLCGVCDLSGHQPFL